MSFVKLSSIGLGLGLSVLLGGLLTKPAPKSDVSTSLRAHQGNHSSDTHSDDRNIYDTQASCEVSEPYPEAEETATLDDGSIVENATTKVLYDEFDDIDNLETYEQRTILEILSLGLDQQQIGTLNEINDDKSYNDYHEDENLSALIVNRISELNADSVTRDYLVSLLRAYPSEHQKVAVKKLIATGSEKDQLSAVDLITNIKDPAVKISTVKLALATNLAASANENLLNEIGADPYISNQDAIRNTLINRLTRTNTSEAAINLIAAIPPKDDISNRIYQEIIQKLDSDNESISLKAIRLSGKLIKSSSVKLSDSQQYSLVKKLENISRNRLNPTQNRMESLDILENLI